MRKRIDREWHLPAQSVGPDQGSALGYLPAAGYAERKTRISTQSRLLSILMLNSATALVATNIDCFDRPACWPGAGAKHTDLPRRQNEDKPCRQPQHQHETLVALISATHVESDTEQRVTNGWLKLFKPSASPGNSSRTLNADLSARLPWALVLGKPQAASRQVRNEPCEPASQANWTGNPLRRESRT